MSLKLYCPIGNPRGNKLLITAKLANVEVENVHVAYD